MLPPSGGPPSDETIGDTAFDDRTLGPDPGRTDEAATFSPGDVLAGRYRIERFLARGGMGEVYCAHDLDLDVEVALKTIRPEIAVDPGALRAFKQEVLTARSVTHPNVCRIYDLGHHQDATRETSFLTMEFLSGETLSSRLGTHGRLSQDQALPIVRQLANGLDAAHQAGIVHRDFKTANVLLVPGKHEERAVITDFGLAMAAETVAPEGPKICGTPAYMAPEQVRGDRVSSAADLYALGVTLFQLRTGELPFLRATGWETAQARLDTPPPRPSTRTEIEPSWEAAILQLLSLDPAARFASAGDAVRALEASRPASDRIADFFITRRAGHSLPAEHDAFVGRRDLMTSLVDNLSASGSLVTLLGAGGTGKTRLARRYGWDSLESWPGGAWFCDLGEARNPDGIAHAVAAALDVPLTKGDTIVQLGHAIAGRGRVLVILDNFEQVVDHAEATVGAWRKRAPEASFLVTSRERLQLDGETVLEVEPLEPSGAGAELFEERAKAQRPGFAVTPENQDVVTEIVRLVDGLPLAIELAASRLRLLSLAQLRERLNDRFSVLAGAKRGRHGTLRATLDWSWSLLTAWEQSAVAQASVFQGGFTLEAAEAVIDLSPYDAPLVLDVIQSLIDKSWLRTRVVLQAPRLSMYATVQEYAAEKLRAAEAADADLRVAVEARHGRYFATLGTEQAIDALDRRGGTECRLALRAELENLITACRAALARCAVDSTAADVAGATYLATAPVLELQGPAHVSVELGLGVLPVLRDPVLRARVLTALASAERTAGKNREARDHWEAARALNHEVGNRRLEGIVLSNLGMLHREQGQMEVARLHYEAALAIQRETKDRRSEGVVLSNIGTLHREQDRTEEARSHYESALAIYREVGDRRSEGAALGNLGVVLSEQGRTEEARAQYISALAIYREVGDRRSEANALVNLGILDLQQGRTDEARTRYEAALAIFREAGDRRSEGIVLGNLGAFHTNQGQIEDARVRYEAALAIHREVGNRRLEGILLGNLGVVLMHEGNQEDARSHYEAAVAIHRELGDRRHEGLVLGNLGVLQREQGQIDDARRSLEDAARILREIGERPTLGKVLCELGTLELQQGNAAAAASALEEAEQISEARGGG